MPKVDLKKELKHLYQASAKEVVQVEVPTLQFLMIDGAGDPNTSQEYAEAVAARRAQYDPEFYMRVTSTLYRFYGLVGGPLQILALLFSAGLVWLIRARVSFRSTFVGTLFLALSLLLWFLLVQPVNAAWLDALRAGPGEAVQAYAQLRSRWETGHAAAFIAWLIGFALLLHGVLREVSLPSSRA